MRTIGIIALLLSLPVSATAAPVQVTQPTDYAVPVETFSTGKSEGKPGLVWDGFSAGGYSFFSKLTSTGRASGRLWSMMTYQVVLDYRFTKIGETTALTGKCQIGTEQKASLLGLVTRTTTGSLYACTSAEGSGEYALEVALPPLGETRVGNSNFSITGDRDADDEKFRQITAKLRYAGLTYEARPTSFDTSRALSRVVDGYVITSNGRSVGRIDFGGNNRTKGTITVPTADADGREAVIFFAAQLLAMPELNAGFIRTQLNLE